LRRSFCATASVAAAWAIAASSIGKTHIVRRIASIRTSDRASYSSAAIASIVAERIRTAAAT
jgi:hypothetical protein